MKTTFPPRSAPLDSRRLALVSMGFFLSPFLPPPPPPPESPGFLQAVDMAQTKVKSHCVIQLTVGNTEAVYISDRIHKTGKN